MTTRVLIYCRSSKDDREGDSLENQEKDCRKYAQSQGYIIVDVLKEDDKGVSGADWPTPEMAHAIELAKQGKYDVLLVRDVKRFSRDSFKAKFIDFALKQYGAHLESTWEKLTNDSDGDFIKGMYYLLAEKDKHDTVKRLADGRNHRVEDKGSVINAGNDLFGYKTKKIDKVFLAEIVEAEAEIIRLIFRLYVEDGLSISGIAKRLNDDKIPTYSDLKGNTRFGYENPIWYNSTVRRILRNEAYCGVWTFGKQAVRRKHKLVDGKIVKVTEYTTNSADKHIKVSIPLIVSRETWQAAQDRLNKNEKGRKVKYEYLLSRRVTCNCGRKMIPQTQQDGKYMYYQCRKRYLKERECTQNNINAKLADEIAFAWLEELRSNKELLKSKLENYVEEKEKAIEPLQRDLDLTVKMLEETKKRYDKLIDMYLASDDFGQEQLLPRKQKFESELKEGFAKCDKIIAEIDKLDESLIWIRKYLEMTKLVYEKEGKEGAKQLADYMVFVQNELREMNEEKNYIGYQDVDYSELAELSGEDRPLTFEEKRALIERFDVKATVITDENGETWLHLTCSFDEAYRKLEHIAYDMAQLPIGFKLVFSDRLLLDFSSLTRFNQVNLTGVIA